MIDSASFATVGGGNKRETTFCKAFLHHGKKGFRRAGEAEL